MWSTWAGLERGPAAPQKSTSPGFSRANGMRLVTGTVQLAGIHNAGGYSSAGALFASTTSIGDARFQVSTMWWIVLTVIAAVVLVRTRFGNWVFALGGSPASARVRLPRTRPFTTCT